MSAGDITNNPKAQYTPTLLARYRSEIVPAMKVQFNYSAALAVPRLVKIVINMGVKEAVNDAKFTEKAAEELAVIAGQKAKICRARKPISNFKLKKGMPIGCCVTMRRYRMYEFLERFIATASPRIRDFRGFSSHGFDGRGSYNFGLLEQNIFPELELDKITRTQGMTITIHTSAKTDKEAKALLDLLGFPFRKQAR
ncbi:MAG: 50S ribosomal protein L5 [Candidatus Omnitrophota bacterium]|nr:50S ribosomal protein L5 [Candidatus Omnitrophota bacterium]